MTSIDTKCPYCQAENPAGSTTCVDCGALLAQPLPATPAAPDPVSVAIPPAPVPPSQFSLARQIRITVARNGRAVHDATFNQSEVLVGRADVDEAGLPVIPELDLTGFDSELLVSRRHLTIRVADDGAVSAEDVSSGNGSFVEGLGKLTPHQPTAIPSGARIMLGRGGPVLTVGI